MIPAKVRSDIAWSYWSVLAVALWGLIWDGLFDGNHAIEPATYFMGVCLVVHAHGARIRDTILALHAPGDEE